MEMNQTLAKILKFPTKAQRKAYSRRLFSKTTLVNVTEITLGIVIGDFVCKAIAWLGNLW